MKILFVCGSQAPGRDGVGDYTRRLACEITRQGHQTAIIAIGDRHVQEEWQGQQEEDNIKIAVLRLPSHLDWDKRFTAAKSYIDAFNPGWISLQFVLFTFDKRGIPFGLSNKIKKLLNNRTKLHIMFHELWIGINKEAPLKQKMLGYVQQQILRSFLNKVKPSVIHTHSSVYRNNLMRLGFQAKPLPLFNNLPVDEAIFEPSEEGKREEQKTRLIFSLFGGIHAGAPAEKFADELVQYTASKHIKAEIRIIGRTSKEQEVWLATFQTKNIETKVLGELSTSEVNKVLLTSHFGLNTTPVSLADKSSSIATMLGHGLPVICVSKPYTIRSKEKFKMEYVYDYELGHLSSILDVPFSKAKAPLLDEVAKQFIQDLVLSE